MSRASVARRGFTLVELLVALTLLGAGLASWVGAGAAALRTSAAAEEALRRNAAARNVAERVATRCDSIPWGRDGALEWSITPLAHRVRLVRVGHAREGAVGGIAPVELVVACP